MAKVTVDVSDLREFSSDLARAGAQIAPAVRAVIVKGAVNIKNAMRADMEASAHFSRVGLARSIDFDVRGDANSVEAEIGPHHGPGETGNLANVAYFGTPRGGGTVRDPQEALDDEIPAYEAALLEVMGGGI